jgi:hypothetical protein
MPTGRKKRASAWRAALAVSIGFAMPTLPGGWRTNGPVLYQANAVAADAARDGSVYAASSIYDARQSAIFHSRDGGKTWDPLVEILTGEFYASLLVDPRAPQRIYAGAIGTGGSGNLYRSADGGATWNATGSVSPSCSPSFATGSGSQTVLAACGAKLLRSADGGATWTPLTAPFTQATRLTPGTGAPGTVIAYGASTVYRTANDGGSWTTIASAPAACPGILALRMDPSNANVLVAGTGNVGPTGVCGGVFRSTNGGATWGANGLSGYYVTDVAIDPRDSSRVYAGASTLPGLLPRGGVFESHDGGLSFTDLRLPASGALRLSIAPTGRLLYAATPLGVYTRGSRRTTELEPR